MGKGDRHRQFTDAKVRKEVKIEILEWKVWEKLEINFERLFK